jgi:membrane protease subunit (stomatin/prohibitin family)
MLTVRESQFAAFVNEGRMADVFGPGLYKLNTQNLPLLTNLMNWDKMFESPFKSDVYFFSGRLQANQKWGTPQPVTVRDKDFGAVRVRAFGNYAWRIFDPKPFHIKVSGTRDIYRVGDFEGQLRTMVIGRLTDTFAESKTAFLDLAANLVELSQQTAEHLRPALAEWGIALDTFVVESVSLPEELQKRLDERISMNMLGDMRQYTQYQAAQSLPIAAANEGGGAAGLGVGLGAGVALGQQMIGALGGQMPGQQPPPATPPVTPAPVAPVAPAAAAAEAGSKFCIECGKPMPGRAKFCPGCGAAQS